jgi:phospholipid/cholesterol/gamma-HCH transport system permease protein
VLLTAIVLAGRTASAFTAQIGAMKSREEIDAIRTLGLDPIDLLVIPRLLALLVMLPLLTFIAMMAGLAGGVTVGAFDLGIPPQMYIARMHETMELRHFLVGMSKAPVFALVIGLIGCLEGPAGGRHGAVGGRTHHLQRGADDLAGHHPRRAGRVVVHAHGLVRKPGRLNG